MLILETEFLKEFFKGDMLAKHLGIELVEANTGKVFYRMDIKNEHLNGIGTVHGGAIFTLADFTFAVAANSHGNVTVAINASISFMKSVTKGTLTAIAKEVSLNPRFSYTVNICNDEGELIAIFQGLAYRKHENIVKK